MFKKSRWKIVMAIMAVLILLFLGTLAVIYGSSYYEVSSRNREMLERYAQLYSLEQQPGTDLPPDKAGPPAQDPADGPPDSPRFEETPAFRLSTFYSVVVSDSGGAILAVNNSERNIYTDLELERFALQIVGRDRAAGTQGSLLYLTAKKDGYTLVAFMDNTVMRESMTTLVRYTLIFGCSALIALFFVAVYLAKWIVRPLEEGYRKQKQFISDAGHELKTPVSVVSANAELLAREIGENPWLANIRYENERMGTLIRQLLELTRTENAKPQAERLDFSRLVAGEALPFESVAFEKGLALDCDISDGLFVAGSGVQLRQLVSILLDNAMEHSSGGVEISLRLSEERGCARLAVVNAGEIPPGQQERLFDRFYRADAARGGEGGHYGLGLAIAKAIVTAHRGKIQVHSHGGRVEFAVLLPLEK